MRMSARPVASRERSSDSSVPESTRSATSARLPPSIRAMHRAEVASPSLNSSQACTCARAQHSAQKNDGYMKHNTPSKNGL